MSITWPQEDIAAGVCLESVYWLHAENGDERDMVELIYSGDVDALVAAGIAERSVLRRSYSGRGQRGRPKGARVGPPRVDQDGDRLAIYRREGDWLRFRVRKPLDRALRVPGFSIAPLLERFRRPPATSP